MAAEYRGIFLASLARRRPQAERSSDRRVRSMDIRLPRESARDGGGGARLSRAIRLDLSDIEPEHNSDDCRN